MAEQSAMEHGGGMTWLTGTYDPELICSTGVQAIRIRCTRGRGARGSNLWTCAIVALNADTGKLVWHFQSLAA
jgi:alcohol dehydrogenase (cytochrome c)